MKGRVLKAIEQQNQLGLILTLRGFLASKGWKSAVYHSEEDRQPAEAQGNSWAPAAIHQFWKVIIGAWKNDRNEVLHNGKTSRFPNRNRTKNLRSTTAEKRKYPGEMAVHLAFGTKMEELLMARLAKQTLRFLERAKYLFSTSKGAAETGEQSIQAYFSPKLHKPQQQKA